MKSNASEIGWMAGFLDGEGCFTITKQKRKDRATPYYRPVVSVTNTDQRGLQVFSECYGGKVQAVKEKRKDRFGVKWANPFIWVCPVSSLPRLLEEVTPQLRMKGEQAAVLAEFLRVRNHKNCQPLPGHRRHKGGTGTLAAGEIELRESLRERVRCLNKKGPHSRNSHVQAA